MKKWVFWLVIILLLGYEVLHKEPEYTAEVRERTQGQLMLSDPRGTNLRVIDQKQIHEGSLLLVNKQYAIHKGAVQPDVVNLWDQKELVQGYGLFDTTVRLSRSVARQFALMVAAAAEDGVTHFMISSGYRDEAEQQQLYEDKGAEYALPPGHSEHNLGLSLDIGSTEAEMSRAPEGTWLKDHAAEYGFILRYPKDKVSITGIHYEPWHFRYVGLPHSLIMQQKNFTLEEYLEYLSREGSISATLAGKTYEISYYPVSGYTSIPVPADRRYEISGNNMEGVIVTVFPGHS
ncbi:D-Ala-D-Ala carboxypeptidase VanY [Paenibacillus sp. PK3_47]|uniref:M15 family metallopeptidase n=1 Tax=Paenibacillus sp. PK3_47 TaxID=2072642 RepID=UPI00201E48E4|nr:M15 family metallopeptidase [Paenibacillus sp. PK3_47]UQZ36237.1 D-Ala-D-Ala carboxypeptidase VanY [Paenibacillus sp. PK3_47]